MMREVEVKDGKLVEIVLLATLAVRIPAFDRHKCHLKSQNLRKSLEIATNVSFKTCHKEKATIVS